MEFKKHFKLFTLGGQENLKDVIIEIDRKGKTLLLVCGGKGKLFPTDMKHPWQRFLCE